MSAQKSLFSKGWWLPVLALLPLNAWLGFGGWGSLLLSLLLMVFLLGSWQRYARLYPKKYRRNYFFWALFPNIYGYLLAPLLPLWLLAFLQLSLAVFWGIVLHSYGQMLVKRKAEKQGDSTQAGDDQEPNAPSYDTEAGDSR